MSGLEAGYRYPDIVRAGIHLVLDPPLDVEIRVDPEGESKAEARRGHHQAWRERQRASGIPDIAPDMVRPMPKLKTIHLQWLDTSYAPVWRDADLHIDLDKKRLYAAGGGIPFLYRGHQGSGAIGVFLFAAPVLAVLSPYLYVRSKLYRSKERRHGMSRHGIVLLEKIKGQLDPETEALLREALKNEWTHDCKVNRHVSLREAGAALEACDLTERVSEPVEGDPIRQQRLCSLIWTDDAGDMIGHAEFVDGRVHFMHVLGSRFFEQEEAETLCARFRSRRVLSDDDE
jgi:hypothetical protein